MIFYEFLCSSRIFPQTSSEFYDFLMTSLTYSIKFLLFFQQQLWLDNRVFFVALSDLVVGLAITLAIGRAVSISSNIAIDFCE